MEVESGMETSPLTKELYSIDWAVRFDEFRKFDQSSYSDLHRLLTKIEHIVEKEISQSSEDLNNIDVLRRKFSQAQKDSPQWHRLAMLINLKIIQAAIPKGLTATATLSAIQVMEHLWKLLNNQQKTKDKATQTAAPKPAKKATPKATAVKKAAAPKPAKPAAQKPAASKPQATKTASNKNKAAPAKTEPAKTENVVIKKLADEAGLDEAKPLSARCYEVASALSEEYPEYTLTAIRVMTAEKLGVTRQYVENLDIRPPRFKNA